MLAYACSPSTQRLRQAGIKFEVSLGYKARPCLQNNKERKKKKQHFLTYQMDKKLKMLPGIWHTHLPLAGV
jgi:hypothetical protein